MIIILGREAVASEVLEWSIYRIAKILRLAPESVHAEWVGSGRGGLDAKFAIAADAMDPSLIEGAIQKVWVGEAKAMLAERLAGLRERRYD